MKIIKINTGITLITLIITVIIMLIIAGVTISLLTSNNGLFAQTKNASNLYSQSIENENGKIALFSNLLDEYLNENQEEQTPTNTRINVPFSDTLFSESIDLSRLVQFDGVTNYTGIEPMPDFVSMFNNAETQGKLNTDNFSWSEVEYNISDDLSDDISTGIFATNLKTTGYARITFTCFNRDQTYIIPMSYDYEILIPSSSGNYTVYNANEPLFGPESGDIETIFLRIDNTVLTQGYFCAGIRANQFQNTPLGDLEQIYTINVDILYDE